MAHRPALRGWDAVNMKRRGIRFGQGLQMTNVLRDLAQDFRVGRCFLPRQDLEALGLTPENLLNPDALGKLRPLLRDLLGHDPRVPGRNLALPDVVLQRLLDFLLGDDGGSDAGQQSFFDEIDHKVGDTTGAQGSGQIRKDGPPAGFLCGGG